MLSASVTDSRGLRQLAGTVDSLTAAAQQNLDPVSDLGVSGAISGANPANGVGATSGSHSDTSGAYSPDSGGFCANSGGFGAKPSVASGADTGSAQHSCPAQNSHESFGHEAAAGSLHSTMQFSLHCIAAMIGMLG